MCSTENVPPWECATIFADIRMLNTCISSSFSWVPRDINRAAHWIATQFLKGSIPPDWVVNTPPFLSSVLIAPWFRF
ncbi:hypothetical protein RHMOL_Rhmol06G0010000 [Rhododendron molle]|uniref:Uncharacterized protein n=1 Tax=Rhododendron molle TaxID=49168 RepID=A0ACC0N7J8_RHOML|nr:hypothetical protein RHMOL_Rhmol06G0010000 [Rhododendron molle]